MASNTNFSILADVELTTKNIQKQLNDLAKKQNLAFKVEAQGTKEASAGIDMVAQSGQDMGLTFQEANLIMQRSLDVIGSMVDQVYELDGAITEFKKVSDYSGKSLENYVAKLTDMGTQVARTGKPKRLALNVQMVNVH